MGREGCEDAVIACAVSIQATFGGASEEGGSSSLELPTAAQKSPLDRVAGLAFGAPAIAALLGCSQLYQGCFWRAVEVWNSGPWRGSLVPRAEGASTGGNWWASELSGNQAIWDAKGEESVGGGR